MTVTEFESGSGNASIEPEFHLNFVFKAYGVAVKVESNSERLLDKAKAIASNAFLGCVEWVENESARLDYKFGLGIGRSGAIELWEDSVYNSESRNEEVALNFFTSYLRVIVAERATDWVFVHAGVVGWKGRAIVIPGRSYSGKTTLVAELLRHGADYLSDEYAVLDFGGRVHPFARDLSVRVNGDRANAVDMKSHQFGGRIAERPLTVGMALFTNFEPRAHWALRSLSLGNAIKEMIPHTIPIRLNTANALGVLNTALSHAIMLAGARPEASLVAEDILSRMEEEVSFGLN